MPQSIWSRRVQIRKRPRLICSAGRWKPGASQQVDCTHCGALGFVAAASHPLLTPVQTAFGFPHGIQAWCSHVGNEPLAATLKSVVMPVGRGCRPGPTVTHGVWAQQPGLPPGQEPQSVSVLHVWNSFVEPVSQIFGPATTVCRYAPGIGWPGTMDSHEGAAGGVVVVPRALLDVVGVGGVDGVVVVVDVVVVVAGAVVVVDVLDVVAGAVVVVDVVDVVTGALVDVDVLDVVTGALVDVVVAAPGEYIHTPFGRQGLCAQDSVAEQRCPWVCLLQLAAVNWPHVGWPSSRKQQVLPVGLTA